MQKYEIKIFLFKTYSKTEDVFSFLGHMLYERFLRDL